MKWRSTKERKEKKQNWRYDIRFQTSIVTSLFEEQASAFSSEWNIKPSSIERQLSSSTPRVKSLATIRTHSRGNTSETYPHDGWRHVTVQSARDSLRGSDEERDEQAQPPRHPVLSSRLESELPPQEHANSSDNRSTRVPRSRGPRWLKVNGETRTCVPFRCGCRGMSRPPPPPRFSRRQSFSTIARLEQQLTTNSIAVTSSLYYRLSWAGFRNARVNLSLGERWEKRRIPLGKQRPTERQPAAAFAFQSDSTTGGLHRMRDHHHGSPTRSKRTPLAGRRESSSFQEFQSDRETTRTETVPRTMEFRKEEPRKKWIEVKGTFHRLFTNCATFNSQTLEFNTR